MNPPPQSPPPADPAAPPADVCLILEGTYPYVQGGVSSWVHQLLRDMPDLRFALVYLGSTRAQTGEARYPVPPNVVARTETFLFDPLPAAELAPGRVPDAARTRIFTALHDFYLGPPEARLAAFWRALDAIVAARPRFTLGNLNADDDAWALLTDVVERRYPEDSFIDLFWTARFMHLPVWAALTALRSAPRARVYHSVSTGYAGLVGAALARRERAPYLITEHGIYTKERIAEVSQATWIHDPRTRYFNVGEGLGTFKQLWIDLFVFLGAVSYDSAHRIVSLFEGNTYLQIEFGAEADRLEVIPNGIDPVRFDEPLARRRARLADGFGETITIGFIGRVVPIKDVKTLIRAARTVVAREPRARFAIIGPTDEDPEYFAECEQMVRVMGLGEHVRFTGPQDVRRALGDIDVCVLTSISEGLPLVILEAFAAGVPCVSTDVGACRELIFGRTAGDKAIGRAGLLTGICSPLDTADALLRVIASPGQALELGEAGRRRVEQHYRQADIIARYRRFYTGTAWARQAGDAVSLGT